MNLREHRKRIAKETKSIMSRGYYTNLHGEFQNISAEIDHCVANAILYSPSDFDVIDGAEYGLLGRFEHKTVFTVENLGTVDAIAREASECDSNVLCLNFASAKNPGGGFLNGSQAQEESLARSSALYPSISQFKEMYQYNKEQRSGLYSDYMIYSPQVPFFRNNKDELLEHPVAASIITSPSVNQNGLHGREKEMVEPVMVSRIRKILSVALLHEAETLILGAWGCGVFNNNPIDVAGFFFSHLGDGGKFSKAFKKVVFAILTDDSQIIKPFQMSFGIR